METIPILTSAGIFSIITLSYGLCKYFMGSSSYPNDDNISNAVYGFYVVIAIFIQLTININNSKALCDGKSPQIIGTMIHTFLPNLLIFIVVGICIRMFPGWLQPFSNTVGYCFLAIFKKLDWLSKLATLNKDKSLIEKDNSLFLNELTPTNFTSVITKMLKAKLINFDNDLGKGGSANAPHDGAPITKPNSGYKPMVGGKRSRRKRKQKGGYDDQTAAQPSAPEAAPALPSAPALEELQAAPDVIKGYSPLGSRESPLLPTKSSGEGGGKGGETQVIRDNKNKLNFQKLWQLVNIKSVISEVIWFLLCGVLVLAYSYNAILNLECSHSLEQQNIIMKEGDEKLEKLMKDIDDS